jgi:HTH-type transcriptional regulator/antitoxin HigA
MNKTYSELLAEIQPQVITNDEQNDVNLAHIEKMWNIENRTPEEEKIFDLLLLLSEQFESKAYPMESPWYAGLWYRVQAFMFRW